MAVVVSVLDTQLDKRAAWLAVIFVAVELQGIALTSGHGHGAALLGQHHALVDHLGRQERDIAPQVRRDVALVQHRAGGALTIKAVVAL